MENIGFDAREFQLKNGLRFINIKKDTKMMYINAGIEVGSLVETKNEKGLSHFVEHMLFKGTKSRNNEKLNAELEQLGGDYNAYTDYTCTVYNISALNEEIHNSFVLIKDMLTNSDFPLEEIERERGVILAEIRSSKDDIEDYSFNRINEIAFEKGPLKYDIIGEEKIIRNVNRSSLMDFYNKYYIPNNCVITLVSNLEHEEAFKLIDMYFSEWNLAELIKEEVIEEKNISKRVTSYKKDIEQSTIIYLYTFYGLSEYEELVLRILNHRFGGSSNSILFRKLREEKGLAYDIYSDMDTTNYVKTLYIYTSVEKENVEEAMNIINQCIESIINKEIIFDDGSMELMKKILKTAVVSTIEDSMEIGSYVLHKTVENNDIYDFIKDIEMLKNIKSDDMYNTAKDVFKNPTIHILLPEKSD